MNPKRENNWDSHEQHDRRAKKLERKKHPRGRKFVGKQLEKASREKGGKKRVEEARNNIEQRLEGLSSNNTQETQKRMKTYTRWVRDSLNQGAPILDEGDLEIKTAVASVKAGGQQRQKSQSSVRITHTPTLIQVRNEEERSMAQNKIRAQVKLFELLDKHLLDWKILEKSLSSDNIDKEIQEILTK